MSDDRGVLDDSGIITGVSLASFLQMMELELKSCTLQISYEGTTGKLFINKGELIDAESDGLEGLNAAFEILSWHNPVIEIFEANDRVPRIKHPLSYIVLNAALQEDEGASQMKKDLTEVNVKSAQSDSHRPSLELVDCFNAIPEIQDYVLLNRQGKVIVQSSPKKKLSDFITYSILMGKKIGKSFELKGFKDILLNMKNGQSLMVLSGEGMIIGLVLVEDTSDDEIRRQVRSALKGIR